MYKRNLLISLPEANHHIILSKKKNPCFCSEGDRAPARQSPTQLRPWGFEKYIGLTSALI
jgi:hypothetical protein